MLKRHFVFSWSRAAVARGRVARAVAFLTAFFAFSHVARATPETYDFSGYVVGSTVLDSAVPLPRFLVPCACPELIGQPRFIGTLVVDLALPQGQRLLDFRVLAFTAETLAALPGHSDNRVVSQTTSGLGIGVPPPHWEIVAAEASTGPLQRYGGRSIGMSLQWSGEPGAPRQYPAGATSVDLAALTPAQSWRIKFSFSDESITYGIGYGNIVTLQRRGTGGPDYDESFDDGLAQGWTPQGGAWSAATGELRNASNTAFTSSISGITMPDEYVLMTDVYLSWGASGNTAGVLFEYYGPGDFFELRLNAQGIVKLNHVAGGVRRTLLTGTYPDAGVRRWSTVYVQRAGPRAEGSDLQIEINGRPAFSTGIGFGPDTKTGGSAGVFASWNLARFDNVLIGAPITAADIGVSRFEASDDANGCCDEFTLRTGTWTIANGYMRSSANQALSIAVQDIPKGIPVWVSDAYGISARLYLEWSGAGNWGGLVYDYVDARNYREVRLSRSVPSRLGEIVLAETVDGVRREVFRASRLLSSTGREVFLTVRREGDRTIVNDPSAFINVQVRQAPQTVTPRMGLLAAWNLVRFDDVVMYRTRDQ